MVLTDAERAASYRYASRVENTASKLLELLEKPPEKFSDALFDLPNKMAVDEIVFECVSLLVNAPWELVEHGDDIALRYVISMEGVPNVDDDTLLELNKEKLSDMVLYDAYERAASARQKRTGLKMTRNAFCERVLEAKLTNARWGWVGVKESDNEQPGKLYIFGWEHNRGRDGDGTVGLFHREVSLDSSGRRRPGHRDALEKIERVRTGDLIPYIVWQTAEDPNDSTKHIEAINGEYLTKCDLYIDKDGYWTGRLLENVSLPKTIE